MRSRSRLRTGTCIPVFSEAGANPIRALTRILGGLFDDNGHITIPDFMTALKDLPPDIERSGEKLNLTPELFSAHWLIPLGRVVC